VSQVTLERSVAEVGTHLPIIDTDFHPMPYATDAQVWEHLPARWRQYVETFGLRGGLGGGTTPAQREYTHRLDLVDSAGRVGLDPHLAREHVLDRFDVSGVVLNCTHPNVVGGGVNLPDDLGMWIFGASNDAMAQHWMSTDDRYFSSISAPRDHPDVVKEIQRCKGGEYGDRFVQVLLSPAGQEPMGRQRYWPIFEACEHYDVPLGFHIPAVGTTGTACGNPNFYAELHSSMAVLPLSMVPSLIFEGVFDRFPRLKIALLEQGWSWAIPLGWRLDAAWNKLRDEVPHLQRKPSEYLKEHFWYSTQPFEEPEKAEETGPLFDMFEESGFGEQLMYSSDYPHWDTDWPMDAVPRSFPVERRRRMLGENASSLYGIPLRPGTGLPVDE
jgi:predicted TIM-barrel fold metal-dependent hydrolase